MADMIENVIHGDSETNTVKTTSLFDIDKRLEQIGNIIYMMAPPSVNHEAIVAEVFGQLYTYLEGNPCRVFGSNMGVDLKDFIPAIKEMPAFQSYFKKSIKKRKTDEVYFLPDVIVLCGIDKSKFSSHGYRGVPTMLVEVTSPSTNYRDFTEKMRLFESIGVAEYWVISDAQNVVVHVLKDGKFVPTIYQTEESILKVPVSVFPGLVIKFDKDRLELS
jgi:Uma2 family endonuclease